MSESVQQKMQNWTDVIAACTWHLRDAHAVAKASTHRDPSSEVPPQEDRYGTETCSLCLCRASIKTINFGKQVRMVGDSTPNQVAKTNRIYESFLLQGNGNAPGRYLESPTVGDDAGKSVCPCVDDIGLHRPIAMRERN